MVTQAQRNKAAKEREAFRQFIALQNERSEWLTIESRHPPEPDLLCQHVKHGYVAFELVAITDPNIASVIDEPPLIADAEFSTIDPTDRIIRKKLQRQYQTACPIDLLVYNNLMVITPDDVISQKIQDWAARLKHPFEHIWYMGEYEAACVWAS